MEESLHVLVVEDETFQRLSLVDILELYNYTTDEAENGLMAWEKLKDPSNHFDLLLIDIQMEPLDGIELLQLIREHEHTKYLNVIMMSANDSPEKIKHCLDLGALDYLIKPIRSNDAKKFAQLIAQAQKPQKQNEEENLIGIKAYDKIQELGKGAQGKVYLVKHKQTGQMYAMKSIQMNQLQEKEAKAAETEVALLKKLIAPTIIRYYNSFVENNCLNIIMEFAGGGGLYEYLRDVKQKGKIVPPKLIKEWTAQLVLGIMFMHSRNILHRDIKTQNMFLTEHNVVKLGDFGIAKQLTTVEDFGRTIAGTPYFMSPEVCKGEKYDAKADIWSMGTAIYEIATLSRPFEHSELAGLIEKICKEDFDPLPQNIDPNIAMLIQVMLNKDPKRRPNI